MAQKKRKKNGLAFFWNHGSVFLVEEVQKQEVVLFFHHFAL